VTFTTIPTSGSKVRASTFSDLITEVRPLSAVKTGDTSRVNNTRSADPDLTIALPANSVWDFELKLLITSAANAAGDFAADLAYPAGAVVSALTHGLDLALPSGTFGDLKAIGITRDSTSPTFSFGIGCSNTPTALYVAGRIEVGATPGSLTLEWAQNATDAVNATTLQDGSTMTCHRVA
jgi:hypothetical protein